MRTLLNDRMVRWAMQPRYQQVKLNESNIYLLDTRPGIRGVHTDRKVSVAESSAT